MPPAAVYVDRSELFIGLSAKVTPSSPRNMAFAINAQNAVVSRLDPSKSGKASLLYSTYLGGQWSFDPFLVGASATSRPGIALDSSSAHLRGRPCLVRRFPHQRDQAGIPAQQQCRVWASMASSASWIPAWLRPQQLVYSTYIGGTESLFYQAVRPGDARDRRGG